MVCMYGKTSPDNWACSLVSVITRYTDFQVGCPKNSGSNRRMLIVSHSKIATTTCACAGLSQKFWTIDLKIGVDTLRIYKGCSLVSIKWQTFYIGCPQVSAITRHSTYKRHISTCTSGSPLFVVPRVTIIDMFHCMYITYFWELLEPAAGVVWCGDDNLGILHACPAVFVIHVSQRCQTWSPT